VIRFPCILLALSCASGAAAQNQIVGPFLQDVRTDSAWIVWETDVGDEATVEWGLDAGLGNVAMGTARDGNGTRLHDVQLTGLAPATRYSYQARTAAWQSAVHVFETPPLSSSDAAFKFIVVTDTQDWSGGKYGEVVEDGMFPVACGGSDPVGCLDEDLAFVLVAGDLVSSGNTYAQYEMRYFDPAERLNSTVPYYSVAGNHEQDSPFYFNYVHLPENGTAGFEEHWYWFDYSNVRIIAMDSNGGYRLQEQLDWLDAVLADTCANPDIDFAFAMFHHGFKSELWTPGQVDYSGDIVRRMEAWSATCDKPSGHFFGHTHGYSRGQSRDVSHVWMNAGTASGAIDYWGAFPQADHPEFQRSFDEYGYTLVEVTAGMEPTARLRRYSRGDDTDTLDNVVKDDLLVTTCPREPEPPEPACPAPAGTVDPDLATLQAGPMIDPDGKQHLASHFQVSDTSGDYAAAVVDEWVRFENWYMDVDTQAGVDITQLPVGGLASDTTYYWRMRYRNVDLCWSRWSDESSFDTSASNLGPNLLQNGDAENGTASWVVDAGAFESLSDGECGGAAPHGGLRYFGIGALCTDGAYGEAHQRVDVSAESAAIDAGDMQARFGAWMRDWNGSDIPEAWLIFRDLSDAEIDRTARLSHAMPAWKLQQALAPIPPGTRSIDFVLAGTRQAGDDNDSYADDAFLQLRLGAPVDPGPCLETLCSNGLDDDGDGLTDCEDPDCATLDADADSEPDCSDCAPNDPGSFALPPEVLRLDVRRLGPPGDVRARLLWTDESGLAGPALAHDLHAGTLVELWADRGLDSATCLADELAATDLEDPSPVMAGTQGWWYLVRGSNACGVGPSGNARSLPPTSCD